MSDTQTIDVSHIRLRSLAAPSEADLKLWNSLTEEEREAVLLHELDEADASGLAPKQSMAEIIAEARAPKSRDI